MTVIAHLSQDGHVTEYGSLSPYDVGMGYSGTDCGCQERIFQRIVECNKMRIKREMPFRATKKERLFKGLL